MLSKLLGYDALDTFYFRQPWPAGVMVLLLLAAVAVAGLLYARESALGLEDHGQLPPALQQLVYEEVEWTRQRSC